MSKLILFDEKVKNSLINGLKILSKAVKVTLGPKGRNVIIKNENFSYSTKDGVSVAKEINLKDKFENMAAEIIKEAALKTSQIAGDGTTTSIVLAEKIFLEGVKHLTSNRNPLLIRKGIEKAIKHIIEYLSELSKPIKTNEEIKQVAKISSNNDEEIGNIIAEAMKKVGSDGIITINEAKTTTTSLDIVEGMKLDSGYLSPYFVNNPEKMTVELENPLIFITDKKISSTKEIVSMLQKALTQESKKSILLIADDIDSDALTTLVVNKLKANLPVVAIKAPGFGNRKKDILNDIAILTNAKILTEERGNKLEDLDASFFGTANKIKVSKEETVIIDRARDRKEIEKRILQIKTEIKNSTSDYEIENLEKRLASFAGGIAVISIGAVSELEMKEKKDRADDALHATKAATKEGIVPGGGVALLRCAYHLDQIMENQHNLSSDEKIGFEIVKSACFSPCIIIADNAGKKGEIIAEKIYEKKGSWGYNAVTDTFCDLVKEGVIDPTLVVKNAIINAASVASLLLTVEVMITEKPSSKEKGAPKMDPSMGMQNMPGMGGFPGMGMM
ncbi:MAG: chaperonin GroEL [Parachlamydiales bacterium]|nr:chaperonin GroEL [Parachlamydiales bacterium]